MTYRNLLKATRYFLKNQVKIQQMNTTGMKYNLKSHFSRLEVQILFKLSFLSFSGTVLIKLRFLSKHLFGMWKLNYYAMDKLDLASETFRKTNGLEAATRGVL